MTLRTAAIHSLQGFADKWRAQANNLVVGSAIIQAKSLKSQQIAFARVGRPIAAIHERHPTMRIPKDRPAAQIILDHLKLRPLLAIGILLALIKSVQFAVDSHALYYFDSGGYLLNALGVTFLTFRSYVYGDLIRYFVLPFHSAKAIVAMQVIMGGFTAWLLAFALVRFFAVRFWIVILAVLVFAFDPVQIVYERMVLAETATLLAMAVYLVIALEHIRTLSLHWLVILSLVGTFLVSLRFVYLPVVLVAAVALPVIAYVSFPLSFPVSVTKTRLRLLALPLIVSCGATLLFHVGYRHLTGRLAQREPAYDYSTGSFLLTTVTPIIEPGDSRDVRISEAVVAQRKSQFPLVPELRWAQLWLPEGLVPRIRTIFNGDDRQTERAARSLALAAIRRNPIGYLELGVNNWLDYWREKPRIRSFLETETGMIPGEVNASDARAIHSAFGGDIASQYKLHTVSRRYHLFARNWYVFLLLSPFLAGLAFWLRPANRRGMSFLFLWTLLLLASTCLGSSDSPFRYLHPFSFVGLASAAILAETLALRLRDQSAKEASLATV
jgi:hypothetical protein